MIGTRRRILYYYPYALAMTMTMTMRSQAIIFLLLLVTQFSISFALSSLPSNRLLRGSSLSLSGSGADEDAASNRLVSSDNTFTCGFYTLGSNAYWLSIWFTNSRENTVVWMANRDKPVNGRGSRLTLTKRGNLILTDLDGSKVWETNATLTNVDRAELLNSGNLVLKDPAGKILWQSFDFPTDTLLPNQIFTKNSRLISRISPENFSPGYFSVFFDSDSVLKMVYNGPEITSLYWPDPDFNIFQIGRTSYNSTRVAVLDDMGTFVSSDNLQFSVSDVGLVVKRRVTIDVDGNLRVYSLNDSSGLWNVTWLALVNQCSVHGLCGRNGVCVHTPEPTCSCPPYYEPTSLTDWTQGCKLIFNNTAIDSSNSISVQVNQVSYYGFDINVTQNVSFLECEQTCFRIDSCQGFQYVPNGPMRCYTKSDLFSGRQSRGSVFFFRIPATEEETKVVKNLTVSHFDCGGGEPETVLVLGNIDYNDVAKQSFKWVYMFAFVGGIGAFELLILIVSLFFFLRKRGVLSRSLEDGYRAISSQFRSFSYGELMTATKRFKEVLGRGGFGVVYKGVLVDDRVVAVKKLEGMVQGEEEFWAEVSTFGRINHMNLARMWGFCSEGKNRLLVYEFIENGSLDKHLFSSSSSTTSRGRLLGWKERFGIALGVAKGLAYLHHECQEWVIHCDVKPGNILLDSEFEPKISDFGLAKLSQRGGGHHGASQLLSKVRGTQGYMAPEWTTNLPLTAKVDVYSFGVVILELVRGVQLSCYPTDEAEDEMPGVTRFVRFAKGKMEEEEEEEGSSSSSWVEEGVVDPRLEGNFSRKQAGVMIRVGVWCVEDDRNKRPTMESVVQLLAECDHQPQTQTQTQTQTPDDELV